MCGRFQQTTSAATLAAAFGATNPLPNAPARMNCSPTDRLLVVLRDRETGERRLEMLRWGLVPWFARELKEGVKAINARAEGIAAKPTFREAFARRRCLVPADNFYEWEKLAGGKKRPLSIGLADGGVFAMAGLWERWKDKATGEMVRTFTIITGPANTLTAPVHDRMPVILDPADWPLWLGEAPAEPAALEALLRPYPADKMAVAPVDPALVKPGDPIPLPSSAAPAATA
jgi:putative SOS response-associated peptidase YedK